MTADGEFRLNRSGLARQLEPILERRMRSLTRHIANQARQDTPVKTGNLGRSIREDELRFVGPFRVESGVTAHADYAAAVHEGSRPHVIRARNASVLAFKWNGEQVFFRSVNHPGVKARPFLLNAARRIASQER